MAFSPQVVVLLDRLAIFCSYTMLFNAVPVFIALFFLSAPYGRYSRRGWGFYINAKLAWFTQELPSLVIPAALLFLSGKSVYTSLTPRACLCTAFLTHYSYRSIYFPIMMRGSKGTPVSVWLLSFVFCLVNGFMQGWSLAQHAPATWRIRHVIGLAIWLFGWFNVVVADGILRDLRKPGEAGTYKVPYGGLFRFVSTANYGAEIIEWVGFAVACGSLQAAAFAFFTFCNLAPRGVQHHRWYLEKMEDYPKDRKAVIPFLW